MKDADHTGQGRFRVWIAGYDQWEPGGFRDLPPCAVALEPAEEDPMSAGQAAVYVEAFNRTALLTRRKIWAVALPVTLCCRGDPQPGEVIGTSSGNSPT